MTLVVNWDKEHIAKKKLMPHGKEWAQQPRLAWLPACLGFAFCL
jgi:hypothetical protein